jgi:hypothetical protein
VQADLSREGRICPRPVDNPCNLIDCRRSSCIGAGDGGEQREMVVLAESGGEGVVAEVGRERLHPLGRTIRMFLRQSQRRPAAGDCFKRGKLSTQKIRHKLFGLADGFETLAGWAAGRRGNRQPGLWRGANRGPAAADRERTWGNPLRCAHSGARGAPSRCDASPFPSWRRQRRTWRRARRYAPAAPVRARTTA